MLNIYFHFCFIFLDKFVEKLPPTNFVAKEIATHLKNKLILPQLPRNGIFQMWTELLMLDLNLPSGNILIFILI